MIYIKAHLDEQNILYNKIINKLSKINKEIDIYSLDLDHDNLEFTYEYTDEENKTQLISSNIFQIKQQLLDLNNLLKNLSYVIKSLESEFKVIGKKDKRLKNTLREVILECMDISQAKS